MSDTKVTEDDERSARERYPCPETQDQNPHFWALQQTRRYDYAAGRASMRTAWPPPDEDAERESAESLVRPAGARVKVEGRTAPDPTEIVARINEASGPPVEPRIPTEEDLLACLDTGEVSPKPDLPKTCGRCGYDGEEFGTPWHEDPPECAGCGEVYGEDTGQ